MKNEIKIVGKRFKSEIKDLEKSIKKYKKIAIFRHIAPDFDALGTQFGLATFIKDNFKDKEVICLGDNHVAFTPRGLFPETDKIKDAWFNEPFLAIIVDVGDKKRIADPRFEKAEVKVKIDHHPVTDKIYDITITDTQQAAASELVVSLLLNFKGKYTLSKEAARFFYIALTGDSGRFQYSSTSAHTFEIASSLLSTGIDIKEIYELMYQKEVKDLEILSYILKTYKVSKHGVCYYVLTEKELSKFGIVCDQGKENVNFFSPFKGINIWCSITEDITEPCFRISIRSRNYLINEVAKKYKGGGHASAAGAQIKDLSELDQFIKDLDDVVLKGF
ncbi:MAG TPA: bifunctional oligoribonuclease/PAP phosphatase NrnA [Candidatus Onthovivens sp.]|nr:bifunctional oligoribonuclease/PAP phosphatase NrnA [Candidatus Onthovivens sp.]